MPPAAAPAAPRLDTPPSPTAPTPVAAPIPTEPQQPRVEFLPEPPPPSVGSSAEGAAANDDPVEPHDFQASAAADFESAEAPRTDASAEFAEFAAPTAVLTPERPEIREPMADMAVAQDPDNEQEMERDLDPEDPEAVMAQIAPPAPVTEPESLTVAVQDSPARLPALWGALVAEFMSLRPLVGSNLRHSRLEWDAGETPALRVVFLDRTAYSLIEDDADFRKSIQGFLAAKAKGRQDYPVRFTLDPDAAAAGISAAAAMPASFGPADPAQREPIINFIKDVFDGRLLG